MEKLVINGPTRLHGDVNISGAKNAAVAILPATLLIDEHDKLVLHPTYYDQSYFDEIYHPRNAWEIANGQDMYATVHPLFGTNTMALFIKLFGMSPFVWRLPGALFGVFMIPLMYGIARRLFRKTSIATIALNLQIEVVWWRIIFEYQKEVL